MGNAYGIWTGVIAGIVAALVQLLISLIEHKFIKGNRQEDQERDQRRWLRDEIGKLIQDVTAIKIPTKTITDDDVIDNAYHLIIADYERSKVLLYKITEPVTIKGSFNTLQFRYEQLQNIRMGLEEIITIEESRKYLIEEMIVSKARLLESLQWKEKEVISKL